MDFDINDKIFESVKNTLNGEFGNINEEDKKQKDLFLKICTGIATEEEKKEYNEISDFKDDISEQLEEYCKIGQTMASHLETKNPTEEKLDFIIEELKDLKEKINFIIESLKETF
jgi:hypothetical protein